jgi:2-polyprenyl-3-methyl-5-hydroxy-6-metoxy-1,4-benzoquinol methylase
VLQDPACRKAFEDLYDEGYFKGTSDFAYTRDSSVDVPVCSERIRVLEKFVTRKPPRRLLDVGCGQGDLLKAAENRGWEATGIDVSSHAVTTARGRGLDVKKGELTDVALPENHFDVITMYEVIEHMPNPRDILLKAHELLKDSGVLVIQTANIDSLRGRLQKGGYYYFVPGHFVYYSFATLKKMLSRSGFRIHRCWFGSELSLVRELRTLRSYYSWYYLAFKKLFNRIKIGRLTFNTVMVVWAVKKKRSS